MGTALLIQTGSAARGAVIDAGDRVGTMRLLKGTEATADHKLFDTWGDPVILKSGRFARQCGSVPKVKRLFIGYGVFAVPSSINKVWAPSAWSVMVRRSPHPSSGVRLVGPNALSVSGGGWKGRHPSRVARHALGGDPWSAYNPLPVPRFRRNDRRHLDIQDHGDVTDVVGRPRRRPDSADRRPRLRPRQVPPLAPAARDLAAIARRQTEHGSGLGRYRWVVERTFAWLHKSNRLLVRYDHRDEIHEAFLALACCLICFR